MDKNLTVSDNINNENSPIINTKYESDYAKELLKYVENNGNETGYYYKIKITEEVSKEWKKLYPEWRDAHFLISSARQYCIDKNFAVAISKCTEERNLNNLVTVMSKRLDMWYRYDKDTGYLKDLGDKNRNDEKVVQNTNTDELEEKVNKNANGNM